MIYNFKQTSKWFLIIIRDEFALPGDSIFNIFQILLKVINLNFVILNDINGAGKDGKNGLILSLQEKENQIIKIDDLLKVLCDVKQFDWGDFFLFKDYPQKWENPGGITDYPNLFIQTDTTIRAIDDTYIYVYTPSQEIVNGLKQNYEIESIKLDLLENLEYPY